MSKKNTKPTPSYPACKASALACGKACESVAALVVKCGKRIAEQYLEKMRLERAEAAEKAGVNVRDFAGDEARAYAAWRMAISRKFPGETGGAGAFEPLEEAQKYVRKIEKGTITKAKVLSFIRKLEALLND